MKTELSRLCLARDRQEPTITIAGPADVAKCVHRLLDSAQEVFLVLALNARHRVLALFEAARGSFDHVEVDPRVVFSGALVAGASEIVLVHNHPSGDPSPSIEDTALTTRMASAGRILNVVVVDHIIVTLGGGFYSYNLSNAGALKAIAIEGLR